MTQEPTCREPGCDRRHYARGWCEMHYRRWRRRGQTDDRPITRTCLVDGCEQPHDARGYCHGHYQRWSRNGDVEEHTPLSRKRQAACCDVDGCENDARRRGLCTPHYARNRRLGDTFPESPLGRTSERTLDGTRRAQGWITQGYRYVPVSVEERHLTNGRAFEAEHRLVIARIVGRSLLPDESVHHANGDKLDNRPDNLELWSVAQPAGQRVSDKVHWACQILERYAPEFLR